MFLIVKKFPSIPFIKMWNMIEMTLKQLSLILMNKTLYLWLEGREID
jgi:hypothetical protein